MPSIPLYSFYELIFMVESYCVLCEVRTESSHTFMNRLTLVFGSAVIFSFLSAFRFIKLDPSRPPSGNNGLNKTEEQLSLLQHLKKKKKKKTPPQWTTFCCRNKKKKPNLKLNFANMTRTQKPFSGSQ